MSETDNTDNTRPEPEEHHGYATVDQEAWTIDRLWTLVEAAEKLQEVQRVGADRRPVRYAMQGLVHGTAVELYQTLGLKCEGENVEVRAGDEWIIYNPEDSDDR